MCRDLIRTAENVAHVVRGAVSEEWSDMAGIGPTSPSVAAVGDAVTIRFFGTTGEPLPAVEIPLPGQHGRCRSARSAEDGETRRSPTSVSEVAFTFEGLAPWRRYGGLIECQVGPWLLDLHNFAVFLGYTFRSDGALSLTWYHHQPGIGPPTPNLVGRAVLR